MDPQFTQAQQDVQARFDDLPEEIMDIIVGGTLEAVVAGIAELYSLTTEQSLALENEIILILSLFLSPATFVDNVQESLQIDRATAQAIGSEVSSEIFELVEDILTAVEKGRNALGSDKTKNAAIKTEEQKTDLQRLAEQFAQKSLQAQTTKVTSEQIQERSTHTHSAPTEVPSESKDIFEKVVSLRTMQGDINRVHGYGAHNEILEAEQSDNQVATAQNELLTKK